MLKMPGAKKNSSLLIVYVLSDFISIYGSRPFKSLSDSLFLNFSLSVTRAFLHSPFCFLSRFLCNQLINRKCVCHSITVFILEMD